MPSPILARADALMQRRRQSSPDQNDLPILTDAVETDDDLPVLNDIANDPPPAKQETVAPSEFSLAPPSSIPPPTQMEHESPIQTDELTDLVMERILAQLPHLIHSAIREVMAEREMTAPDQKHD